MRRLLASLAVAILAAALPGPATAAEPLAGAKRVLLETDAGERIDIGRATFAPKAGGETAFKVELDASRFQDFFLSMREFKCVEGREVQCHVPYPYANPGVIRDDDMSWLETSLIFMFKTRAQFGAALANGLYYPLTRTERGLAGAPHLVDLNQIAAPPDDPSRPPFPESERLPVEGGRWITRLLIE